MSRVSLALGLGACLSLGLLVTGCETPDTPPVPEGGFDGGFPLIPCTGNFNDGYPWPIDSKTGQLHASPCYKTCGPSAGNPPGIKWCTADGTTGSKGAGNVSCAKCIYPNWDTGVRPWDGTIEPNYRCFDPRPYSHDFPKPCASGVTKNSPCLGKECNGEFCTTILTDTAGISKVSACACDIYGRYACGSWSGISWI